MRSLHPRLAPPSWLHLPRRTARLRLTLLYGGLFSICGAALLTITYLLSEQAIDRGQAVPIPPVSDVRVHHLEPASGGSAADALAAADRLVAAERASDLHHLLVSSGIALALVAMLAILLGWYVAGRVLRPVRTITATARRISATNLHERLALDRADEEFKDLGGTLDDLFARLEATFEAQRHFVANASHELRTPLTAERALLQLALDDPDTTAETWRSTSQAVIASNRQQERLIDALLALASSEGGLEHREHIDLSALCDGVLLRRELDAQRLGLHVRTRIRPAVLDGDPRLVERLVANLVDNAIKHNVVGGRIQVSTAVTDGKAVLSVSNTGPVIPISDIDRLFQPFQRLDPRRTHHKDGHGLGLSIVRAIATAHSATITAHPQLEGGLLVSVSFPAPTTPHSHAARSPRSDQSRGGHGADRSDVGEPDPASQPDVPGPKAVGWSQWARSTTASALRGLGVMSS
jgi:signal transduction histidine kinase